MTRVAALAVLALAGCSFEPPQDRPITPTPEYRAIWDSAQACTGVRAPFDSLEFYLVEVDEMPGKAGRTFGTRIYLRADYLVYMVVKHEMIHALGFGNSGNPHPPRPFEEPCRATWETASKEDKTRTVGY